MGKINFKETTVPTTLNEGEFVVVDGVTYVGNENNLPISDRKYVDDKALLFGVNIEDFGTVGDGANDNALLTAAVATGKTVFGMGAEYRFDQLEITSSASIIFGKNTVVKNVQASGTKKPAITFKGTGLTGSAISVTAIGGSAGEFDPKDELVDTITVSDASVFSVGNTVKLSENEALQLETNVSTPTNQDFNNWDFRTILSITGNDIQFEEYIRLPFDTANSLTLQKVEFLEGVDVSGGKWVSGNAGAGGLKIEYCRNARTNDIKGFGNSESDKAGGDPVTVENCWECTGSNIYGKWTLFGFRTRYSQSCVYSNVGGKRTSNGGVMSVGDKFCIIGPIVQDSSGDDNGDGLGVHSGSKFCTFGPFLLSGARCYGVWIKQPSTDNTFLPFITVSGITTSVLCMGDRNHFQLIRSKGDNGTGLSIEANDVVCNWLDYEGAGAGLRVRSGYSGAYVRGRAVTTSPTGRDAFIGACSNLDIDIEGGNRGIDYPEASKNATNQIIVRGLKAEYYGRKFRERGWSWGKEILSVSSTAQLFKVPDLSAAGTDGLIPLTPPSGDSGVAYLITLQTRVNFSTANSQYQLIGRQSTWFLTEIRKGASSFAPTLQINASEEIEILSASSTALPVFALVEKF